MTAGGRGSGVRTLLGLGGGLTGLLLFFAAWEWGNSLYGNLLLPGPQQTLASLAELGRAGELLPAALATTGRALAGFLCAAVIGTMLGMLAGLSDTLGRMLEPVSTVLLGIPPIAWIVLALVWFGSGTLAPVFTVAATTVPITFAGAQMGARTVDPRLAEMADAFRVPWWMRLIDIDLPHVVSYLFPALVTTLGVAWKVTVMGELFATEDGIGAELAIARVNLDTAAAMAWIALLVALLLAVEHGILRLLQRRVEPWRQPRPGAAGG